MSSYLVSSGVTSQGIILNSGDTMQVLDGGFASNTSVNESGTAEIQSGGSAQYVRLASGGVLEVRDGAKVTQLYGDGEVYVSGGEVNDGLISGLLYLYSGEVNHVNIASNGVLRIDSNGAASGGSASDNACVYVTNGGTMTNFSDGGYMEVGNSATATSTCLENHGRLHVKKNGYLYDTEIAAGYLLIQAGGVADNVDITDAGGICAVMNGGTVSNITVEQGGNLYLYGGSGSDITVTNGALSVSGGAVARNVEVSSQGSMTLAKGGVLTGKITLDEAAVVSACVGSEINFDISVATESSTPFLNNLSVIYGAVFADYTITVGDNQNFGTFALAGGATDFINTITVQTVSGQEVGKLSLNSPLSTGEYTYTLKKDNDTLTLAVTTAKKHAASDIDGNNISDVMFQYIGGDYRLGYWMNGTNQWKCKNVAHPADWTVLGAYDMDSNGKADAVMVGNVYTNGQNGAFVGYYKNGDDTDSNWVTIGYFANEDNLEWNNAVGNLTGNKNKNSIVWHAPEWGVLGVWTDGTTNWVSLGNGFDESWTMVGCGDFNGNGKDKVLFEHNGFLYTVDIDSNFVSLGGWGTDWSVRAIGDFSGDGCDDIVLFNDDTGSVVRLNHGQANDWVSLGQLDAQDWFVVGAGDYNNDKVDDLLVRQYSTGMLGYYSEGDMSKWVELGRGVDMNWAVIA